MKIGIFGGSFDPLHSEHISVIDGAKSRLKMDKVLLLPTYNPPHKEGGAVSYAERVEMLKIFTKSRDYVEIDETERQLNLTKSYAYIVLSEIKKKYPSDDLYYIIGSDSLRKFDSWARPDLVLKSVKVVVIGRGNDEGVEELCKEYSRKYSSEIIYGFTAKEESSSSIRLALELQRYDELKGRIYPPILEYIKERGLYSKYNNILCRLKESLSERTYEHSIRTAEFMVENAWRVWEDYDRALLAGLLHDSAKGRAPLKDLSEYDTKATEVIHQYDGAVVAEKEYGICDEVVLDAIRYHTTGKPNFSPLGKLLYIADKLERGRDYEGVEELRAHLEKGIDETFKRVLEHGIEYLRTRNKEIDLLTLRAYEWYNR